MTIGLAGVGVAGGRDLNLGCADVVAPTCNSGCDDSGVGSLGCVPPVATVVTMFAHRRTIVGFRADRGRSARLAAERYERGGAPHLVYAGSLATPLNLVTNGAAWIEWVSFLHWPRRSYFMPCRRLAPSVCWVACRCVAFVGCDRLVATTSNRVRERGGPAGGCARIMAALSILLTGADTMGCGDKWAGQRPCGHELQVVRRPQSGSRA